MTSMYTQKPIRVVDPNAPPRPNLLSHEKVLKDNKSVMEDQRRQIVTLQERVDRLEGQVRNQTAYLNQVQHHLAKLNK